MKKSKRLEFMPDQIRNIATAAASKGLTAKLFMEQSVIAATLMALSKLKTSKR